MSENEDPVGGQQRVVSWKGWSRGDRQLYTPPETNYIGELARAQYRRRPISREPVRLTGKGGLLGPLRQTTELADLLDGTRKTEDEEKQSKKEEQSDER